MGLDMSLRQVKRIEYNNYTTENFWEIDLDLCIELAYWRKNWGLHYWFEKNVISVSGYSRELTKEKLNALVKWLDNEGSKKDAIIIQRIINKSDFVNNVIFYSFAY